MYYMYYSWHVLVPTIIELHFSISFQEPTSYTLNNPVMRLGLFLILIVTTLVASCEGLTSAEGVVQSNYVAPYSNANPTDQSHRSRYLKGSQTRTDKERKLMDVEDEERGIPGFNWRRVG